MPKTIAVERGRVRDEATTTYREQSIAKIQPPSKSVAAAKAISAYFRQAVDFMVRD